MITGEQLKEIRKNFGLKIKEVSRGTFISEGAISNIENNTRQPSLDTLEVLANFYGYELDLNLIEKKSYNKKINFYKRKTAKEILELSKEDLVEYIFVTQDDEVISRLVNIDINTLKLINLKDLRNILNESIQTLDNLIVYYMINNLYSNIEKDVVEAVKYFARELDNDQQNTCINKFSSSIHYIDLGIVYDDWNEEWDTYFDDIKLYDKNMNLLNICGQNCDEIVESCDIEDIVRDWRGDSIDNQELMRSLTNPLQIRF